MVSGVTTSSERVSRWRHPRYVVYLSVLVVNFFHLVSYTNIAPDAHTKAFGDALNYIEMAKQTFAPVDNPFALRVLTPWVVHNLQAVFGVPHDYVWMLVTYLAISATLIVFFKLLYDQLHLSFFVSTAATLMLGFTNFFVMYNYGNFWLVDPVNNLFLVLGIYFLVKRKLLPFAIVIVLGTINKETTLFIAPLYPLLQWARTGRLRDRTVIFGVLTMVVATAFYLVFRTWALSQIGGGNYQAFSGQNGQSIFANIRFALNSHKGNELGVLYDILKFTWLLFGYGLYLLYRQSKLRSELLVISIWLFATCVFGRLFATDTERVFVLMAPVVIAVAAVVLNRFDSDRDRLWVSGITFVYVALNLGWVPGEWAMLANLGAMVIFVAALRPYLKPAQPGPPPVESGPESNGTVRFPPVAAQAPSAQRSDPQE